MTKAEQFEALEDRRCGTCGWFVFGHRSYCGWPWCPSSVLVSSAFKAGGEGHAMWINDGKECQTWKPDCAAALRARAQAERGE